MMSIPAIGVFPFPHTDFAYESGHYLQFVNGFVLNFCAGVSVWQDSESRQ